MYKYIGAGEFYPGIPARDLTDAAAKACGADKLPLYKYEKDVKGQKEAKEEKEK